MEVDADSAQGCLRVSDLRRVLYRADWAGWHHSRHVELCFEHLLRTEALCFQND